MPIRITGMNSGLDTESIISELVKAKSAKKDDLVKAQTKLQWKQDAWKELNSKVYSLYSKTLSNMRIKSDYLKKTTKVSNSNAASVITGVNAVNGVQTLKIEELAKSGYLTGGKVKSDSDIDVTSSTALKDLGIEAGAIRLTVGEKTKSISLKEDMSVGELVTQLKEAGVNASFDTKNQRFFISAKESGLEGDFSLVATNEDGLKALNTLGLSTEADYVKYFKKDENGKLIKAADGKIILDENKSKALIDAEVESRVQQYGAKLKEFDEIKKKLDETPDDEKLKTKRDELNAYIEDNKKYFTKGSGEYDYTANDDLKAAVQTDIQKEISFANAVLKKTNPDINFDSDINTEIDSEAHRIEGQDAKIFLNGAEFTSNSNIFEINGLTITANTKTAEEFTITTEDDTEGIYDMIKDFFKEYNTLINEMDSLYNAASSKGYEPLTDEEKEAMSEKEVEKWEEKIKKSILRKDSTLSSVASAMKSIMAQGIDVKDEATGEDYGRLYLSDFGINTLGYFTAKDNEKGAYHIDGDPDDASTSGNGDKLKTAIANDPNKVVNFFTQLSKSLYEKLGDLMKKTDYSSSFTLYDDVAMKEDYDDYTSKIKSQEQKITAFEDRYYKKFSAMETALAKMSSKESAISGLLGM